MPLQYSAAPRVTLVAGGSGSGKTTLVLKYLCADLDLHTRFIFDPEGEFSARLKLPAAENEDELICAAEDGFAIFDPSLMFPGQFEDGFRFFCEWSLACAEAMPGRKVLVVDEAWKYCAPSKLPPALAACIQTGRRRGLGMMFATQRPHLLNGSITNETTELICFRLQEPRALERVEFFGVNPAEISTLQPGAFVAKNCRSGGELRGNIFRDRPGAKRAGRVTG